MIRWLWNQMMKWGWDFNRNLRERDVGIPICVEEGKNDNMHPTVRIGVINIMNGTVLEIGTYKPNSIGPDWNYEHFIVPPDKKLSEAITMFLLLKGLDK